MLYQDLSIAAIPALKKVTVTVTLTLTLTLALTLTLTLLYSIPSRISTNSVLTHCKRDTQH